MIRKLAYWLLDYVYATGWQIRAIGRRHPPRYSGDAQGQSPVIMIPGVYEPWLFMKPLADTLQPAGHPVYFVEELGYHTMRVQEAAVAIRRVIDRHRLTNVMLVAHSKGGLVGKYALSHYNRDSAIAGLIAIATPFSGSAYARWWLLGAVRALAPKSPLIRQLQADIAVNASIVSIYGCFDPHIPGGSHLAGATNIHVPAMGHFRILNQPSVKQAVLKHLAARSARPSN